MKTFAKDHAAVAAKLAVLAESLPPLGTIPWSGGACNRWWPADGAYTFHTRASRAVDALRARRVATVARAHDPANRGVQ